MSKQKSILILGFVILVILISGCTQKDQDETRCGIENCHGTDITCGPDVPDACTMEYAFGDRCRQYAICTMIDGECRLLKNEKFDACKSCAEKCETKYKDDISKTFECESTCPETQMASETSCEKDEDCACGVHKTTGDCFYGNRDYVDTDKQCPDFCTGIAGNLKIRCIENICTQTVTSQ
ncbi:MAG: hypothetical protein V1718_02145 [archaeon]